MIAISLLFFNFLQISFQTTKLFIGILSAPENYDRRRSVRESWMQTAKDDCASIDVDVKFMIGESSDALLSREQTEYNDIVRLNGVVEEYKLLAKKTAALFRYATTVAVDVDLVMKTDDDVYLNLRALCNDLSTHADLTQHNYYGFFHNKSFVIRHPNVKFAEPNQNDCQHHLPYASGCGYIISRSLASYIGSPPVALRQFNNEDVFVGFVLAPLDVRRMHRSTIRPERALEHTSIELLCPGYRQNADVVLQHRFSPGEMLQCFKLNRRPLLKDDNEL